MKISYKNLICDFNKDSFNLQSHGSKPEDRETIICTTLCIKFGTHAGVLLAKFQFKVKTHGEAGFEAVSLKQY